MAEGKVIFDDKQMTHLAQQFQKLLPDGVGFCITVFDPFAPGLSNFVTNTTSRMSAYRSLKGIVEKMEEAGIGINKFPPRKIPEA